MGEPASGSGGRSLVFEDKEFFHPKKPIISLLKIDEFCWSLAETERTGILRQTACRRHPTVKPTKISSTNWMRQFKSTHTSRGTNKVDLVPHPRASPLVST